jgi:hypothetical protein
MKHSLSPEVKVAGGRRERFYGFINPLKREREQ